MKIKFYQRAGAGNDLLSLLLNSGILGFENCEYWVASYKVSDVSVIMGLKPSYLTRKRIVWLLYKCNIMLLF